MTTKMTVVRGDGWEGIYINGKLKSEGHSFRTDEAARMVIENDVGTIETKECDFDWLDERGSLPDALSEVKMLNG